MLLRSPRSPDPFILGRPASAWAGELANPDFEARAAARHALSQLEAPAVPHIVRALQTRDIPFARTIERVRRRTGITLVQTTDRSGTRERAASLLGEVGATTPEALTALVLALRDASPNVIREAEGSLRRQGGVAVPALVRFLEHSDPRLRVGVARVLRDLGPLAARAAPRLREGCADADPGVRRFCVLGLGAVGLADEPTVAVLERALADPVPEVRVAAAGVFGAWKTPPPRTEATLRRALRDPVASVRVAAAKSLWGVTPDLALVVPVLAGALGDRDAGWQAAFALGEIGPRATSAVPALIHALVREQGPRPLREAPSSAFALGRIGEAAVGPLIRLLAHETPRVRTSASIALGFIGSAAWEAGPALVRLMADKDPETRQAAILALATVVPETEGLAAALIEMTRADDIHVSNAAASSLRKIDPLAAASLPAE